MASFWETILKTVLSAVAKEAVKSIEKPEDPVKIPVDVAPVDVAPASTPVAAKVYKITMDEILKGQYKLEDLDEDVQNNLKVLQERVNKIRELWGKAMTVTSGFRSMDDHIRIYKNKAKKEGKVFDESKVPKKSKHLYGQALDISDPNLALTKWLKENNSQRLVDAGLWCEEGNSNWVHFQCVPPGSGKRWFLP